MVTLETACTALSPTSLHLIILPTEQCNFRCTYCYEDFSIGRMSSEVVNSLKLLAASRVDDLDELSLSWFGGEPLLALGIVLDVSGFSKALFEAKGKRFKGTMTTNGYLLSPQVFLQLLDVGVRDFQITLDGPPRVHDLSRVRADGKPTFERIWSNLLSIAELARERPQLGCHISIRIHYDANTAYLLVPLLDDIRCCIVDSATFSIHFHGIERLGGAHNSEIASPTSRERTLVKKLRDRLTAVSSLHSTQAADQTGYVCYAARANSLVVRASGQLAKCTVAFNDPTNHVGRLCADGTIELIRDRWSPWLRGLFTGDATQLACPLKGIPEALYQITVVA